MLIGHSVSDVGVLAAAAEPDGFAELILIHALSSKLEGITEVGLVDRQHQVTSGVGHSSRLEVIDVPNFTSSP